MNKNARMEVCLLRNQLDALKKAEKHQGIPDIRLVRQFIDEGMRSLHLSSQQ